MAASRQHSTTWRSSARHSLARARGRMRRRSESWPPSRWSASRWASPWPLAVASIPATRAAPRRARGEVRGVDGIGPLLPAGQMEAHRGGEGGEGPPHPGDEPGGQDEPPEQVRRDHLEGGVDPAAGALRRHLEDRRERAERAVDELADVAEALLADPIDQPLAPPDGEGAKIEGAEVMHRAVGLGDLGDAVAGEIGGLVEARGVGEDRPHRGGRLVEPPHPGPAYRLARHLTSFADRRRDADHRPARCESTAPRYPIFP